MVALFHKFPGHNCVFQHCMHGGTRDKKTNWWSYNPRQPEQDLFATLALMCDGSHTHEPWTPYKLDGKMIYPTRSEASYPKLLCDRIAAILCAEARARHLGPKLVLKEQLQADEHVGKRQLFTFQPRQQRLKPLLPEYGTIHKVFLPLGPVCDTEVLRPFCKGAKILERHLRLGFSRDALKKCSFQYTIVGNINEGDRFEIEILDIGLPRDPISFMAEAAKAVRPRHLLQRTTEGLKYAVRSWFEPEQKQVT